MCIISEKITFCTCKTTNVRKLKNYWVLYQYNKSKGLSIVGEVFIDFSVFKNDYKVNRRIILERLAQFDAFDVPMDFQNKQFLEIVINNEPNAEPTTYCFQFLNGVWKNKPYHPMDIEMYFDEIKNGKIINNAIKSK